MRRIGGIVTTGVLLVMLSGCVGGGVEPTVRDSFGGTDGIQTPAPVNTTDAVGLSTTELSNAKGVVLEYSRALTEVVVGKPETLEAAAAFSTESRRATDQAFYSSLEELKFSVSGESRVTLLELIPGESSSTRVVFNACLDNTSVVFRDENGGARIPPGNVDYPPVTIELLRSEPSGKWLVELFANREGGPEC